MEIKTLNSFIDLAKQKGTKTVVVAAAEDEPVLSAIKDGFNNNIIKPILIGNADKIKQISEKLEFDISKFEIINELQPSKSAQLAVKIVREGGASILMKGLVATADYLRAILNKEYGLRSGELLSHIGFFEVPAYHKIIALTDAAQNMYPELSEKISIVNNAVDCLNKVGINNPKVALIAAIEGVNPKMPATIDAAAITMMNRRGQIKNCIIDGPLAFDNAVSKEAAEHKGIKSDVAGDADLIVAPNIDVGNALYKSFTYFAQSVVAAIILGATVPIVLTSRADSDKSKLLSLALAASY